MTDRDAGYREGIEAACLLLEKMGARYHQGRDLLETLRAFPSTPDDGKAEPVERNEIEHRLAMSMNDTLCEMIDNKEEMITTVITAKVIASKPFQQAIDKLASRPSPASDGAIREALIEARDELREHDGDYHHSTRKEVLTKIENAISAHAGDATK